MCAGKKTKTNLLLTDIGTRHTKLTWLNAQRGQMANCCFGTYLKPFHTNQIPNNKWSQMKIQIKIVPHLPSSRNCRPGRYIRDSLKSRSALQRIFKLTRESRWPKCILRKVRCLQLCTICVFVHLLCVTLALIDKSSSHSWVLIQQVGTWHTWLTRLDGCQWAQMAIGLVVKGL